jgi:hypothetical protein
MATEIPAEREQVIYGIPRELAEVGLTADLAVARLDRECIYTASDGLVDLQRSWAGLYRRLLAVRVPRSQVAGPSSV